MKTLQESYDTVKKHLLCQMKQSRFETGSCKFRGPDGLKCAIGALIPDDKYILKLDVWSNFKEAFKLAGVDHLDRHFLGGLVSIHDGREPEHWKVCLENLASAYGLTP